MKPRNLDHFEEGFFEKNPKISEIAISPQSHNLTIPEFFPGRDGSPRSRIPENLEKLKGGTFETANFRNFSNQENDRKIRKSKKLDGK